MGDPMSLIRIPLMLQHKIIKKMKIQDLVRLQQTGKHFGALVDNVQSKLLTQFRAVENTPAAERGFQILKGTIPDIERMFISITNHVITEMDNCQTGRIWPSFRCRTPYLRALIDLCIDMIGLEATCRIIRARSQEIRDFQAEKREREQLEVILNELVEHLESQGIYPDEIIFVLY